MKKRKKYESQILWGVTAMGVVAFYFLILRWGHVHGAFGKLSNILMPIIIGLVIAFLLDSMVEILKAGMMWLDRSGKHDNLSRYVAIFLAEAVMLTAIALLVSIILPQLISSVTGLISNMGVYMQGAHASLEPILADYPELEAQLNTYFDSITSSLQDFLNNDVMTLVLQVTDKVRNVSGIVYNMLIGIIVSIYFLGAKERLIGIGKKLVYTFFPVEVANAMMEAGRYSVKMFKGFFVGKIWDSLIVGIICFIGLTLLKMPYALLVSIVVGVTNIIPYFGPFIGAIPSALLILVVDPKKCLIFLIFILILQQVDGNIIGPKVLGDRTGVSSLGVLFSILVGGGLFGVVGMLVSVPTFAVLCWLVGGYCEERLSMKGLPLRSREYVFAESLPYPSLEDLDVSAEEEGAKAGDAAEPGGTEEKKELTGTEASPAGAGPQGKQPGSPSQRKAPQTQKIASEDTRRKKKG